MRHLVGEARAGSQSGREIEKESSPDLECGILHYFNYLSESHETTYWYLKELVVIGYFSNY